MPTSDFAIKDA